MNTDHGLKVHRSNKMSMYCRDEPLGSKGLLVLAILPPTAKGNEASADL